MFYLSKNPSQLSLKPKTVLILPSPSSKTPLEPTPTLYKSDLTYKINLPSTRETDFKPDRNIQLIDSVGSSDTTSIKYFQNHKPKTDKNDKDVVEMYGLTNDLSFVETIFVVKKFDDRFQSIEDLFAFYNDIYQQQKQLMEMKAKGEDPCGPWWEIIEPETLKIGEYEAIHAPYKAFCQYESAVPSTYHGQWMIFPSHLSKEYVVVHYVYSQTNEEAKNSVKQLEEAIQNIQIETNNGD